MPIPECDPINSSAKRCGAGSTVRGFASRVVSRLKKDVRGAVLMEFGFVAAPFLALLVAGLHTSLVFFAQQNLETAAQKAGRNILTGSSQNANQTAAQFKTSVCAGLPTFLDCSKVMVDLKKVTSFTDVTTTQPTITFDGSGNVTNAWAFDKVNPGDIAILRVMYPWPTGTGPLGFSLANMAGNQRLLVATAVFRSEPYK
jgi:Flp pilus assembly protein TadG